MIDTTARVEMRTQHAVGTWPRQGPDTYVAVQVVPPGATPLRCLSRSAAERRGIKIIYCGEGYRKNDGPRSALGQALRKANEIADGINDEQEGKPSA